RQWLRDEVLQQQLNYWRTQLQDAPALLLLPTDSPHPAVQQFQGASRVLPLAPSLARQLRQLSREQGVTLFMTLLAAWQLLLSRYSGQEDVVVGTPIANRTRADVEPLIGLFLNTLVLRTDLSGHPRFQDLLRRVRTVVLGAFAHQDVPFERLVEALQPQRDLSQNPLFNVMINYYPPARMEEALPGLRLEPVESGEPASKFALTLYVQDEAPGLTLRLVYQRRMFSAERIARMLEQFQGLLEQLVSDPGQDIHTYSLLTAPSRALLPDPRAPMRTPTYPAVLELVRSQLQRCPDRVAISQGAHHWTYQALIQRADTLALVLGRQGLEPGVVVAVLGQRSFGLLVSLLAVWMRRGILLPLDRQLPVRRQRQMLEQAGAGYLLCSGAWLRQAPWIQELSSLTRLHIEAWTGEVGHLLARSEAGLTRRAEVVACRAAADAAYIVFTSGTTGQPTGVLGSHQGLAHFLAWQRTRFAVGEGDRCAHVTGLSF